MQKTNDEGIQKLLSEGVKITDMNAAIFDAANSFHGCIPGIHEVLRRQGLLEGPWCLNPKEQAFPRDKWKKLIVLYNPIRNILMTNL